VTRGSQANVLDEFLQGYRLPSGDPPTLAGCPCWCDLPVP